MHKKLLRAKIFLLFVDRAVNYWKVPILPKIRTYKITDAGVHNMETNYIRSVVLLLICIKIKNLARVTLWSGLDMIPLGLSKV